MVPAILNALLPLLVIGSVITIIVVAARHRDDRETEPGIGTPRRVFLYILSLASLATAATGATLLLRSILEALFLRPVVVIDDTTLALGLALTMVGTPVWLGFSWLAHRTIGEHPVEAHTLARKLYLYIVLTISSVAAATSAIMFLQWLLGIGAFSGAPPAVALVWGATWAYHWRLQKTEDRWTVVTVTVWQLYVYLLSLFGLILLAVGGGTLLQATLVGAYRAFFGAPNVLVGAQLLWNDSARASLATLIVGAAVWWWHWWRLVQHDREFALRGVYIYLFAILGAAATLIASASVLLYHVLQWLWGRPEATSIRAHFDLVPGLIAAAIVGGGIWGYHWAIAREDATRARLDARPAQRVYSYLVASIGLVTLGAGFVILCAVFLGVVAPSAGPTLRGDLWRNPLILAVTMLSVGIPLWGIFWRDAQRSAHGETREEQSALVRQVFLYSVIGLSGLVALVNLSIVAFNAFDTLLGDRTLGALLWDSRWSLSILLTTGAVGGYYWLVLQEDRRASAAMAAAPTIPSPARKLLTAIVGETSLPIVRQLESLLGYEVTVWRQADDPGAVASLSDEELAELVQQISAIRTDQAVLLVDQGGVRVLPYLLG